MVFNKRDSRIRRARATRAKIFYMQKLRLCVYRSNKHIYAQIISETGDTVLASASTVSKSLRQSLTKTWDTEAARLVGKQIGELAIDKGIKSLVFDRSGYKFHGKVKALAEAARETGLLF